jgi:hypothetical protein
VEELGDAALEAALAAVKQRLAEASAAPRGGRGEGAPGVRGRALGWALYATHACNPCGKVLQLPLELPRRAGAPTAHARPPLLQLLGPARQADEAASRGAARWYRLREAALLVLGNLLISADEVRARALARRAARARGRRRRRRRRPRPPSGERHANAEHSPSAAGPVRPSPGLDF